MEDYLAMYNNWAYEDIVTKFLTWHTHSNPEVTKSVLTDWINNYSKKDFYNWAIELKSEKTIIGNISVVNYREETMSAILGYCMGSKWWGNEIMPEAASAVLKYLFEEVGFNRIAADHDKNERTSTQAFEVSFFHRIHTPHIPLYCDASVGVCDPTLKNQKSGRVMKKIGMKYEGTLRKAGFCNQGIIDEVWYSILKEEWKP